MQSPPKAPGLLPKVGLMEIRMQEHVGCPSARMEESDEDQVDGVGACSFFCVLPPNRLNNSGDVVGALGNSAYSQNFPSLMEI